MYELNTNISLSLYIYIYLSLNLSLYLSISLSIHLSGLFRHFSKCSNKSLSSQHSKSLLFKVKWQFFSFSRAQTVCVSSLSPLTPQNTLALWWRVLHKQTLLTFSSTGRLWRTLCPQQSRRGWCSESRRTEDIDLSCLPPPEVRQACGRQKLRQLTQHVCPPSVVLPTGDNTYSSQL